MASTPEGRVKQATRQWLKARNIYFYQPMQSGMGVVGIPDFICCVPPMGKFLAIETKAQGKRANLTENQKHQISLIQQAHGWAIVVDDVKQLDEFWTTVQGE